ncbi:hypothetical protein CCM_02609 [Cordyceps militaris CM01]|uniref:Uncharacterized protein n=1 Tax=Cordyceps militaris (strain CM01) TaxID=983644 RepID=G3JAS5_CORMM|nr:uncharacterized protein CCM_02609 [Cordyceps militaris CM01]EGX94338.1 hypothetical protein CCM_02609 [Cordyceps militaris CM01]
MEHASPRTRAWSVANSIYSFFYTPVPLPASPSFACPCTGSGTIARFALHVPALLTARLADHNSASMSLI